MKEEKQPSTKKTRGTKKGYKKSTALIVKRNKMKRDFVHPAAQDAEEIPVAFQTRRMVKFEEVDLAQIRWMSGIGLSIKDIAGKLGISTAIFMDWRKKKPEIDQAIDEGRAQAAYEIAKVAYMSAAQQGIQGASDRHRFLTMQMGWMAAQKEEVKDQYTIVIDGVEKDL